MSEGLAEPTFLFDDAYIALSSAMALASGGDPHYPTAAPLHGVTSPVHVALVALAARVLPGTWSLLFVSGLGTGLYIAALLAMARRTSMSRLETAAFVVAGAGSGWLVHHLVNGLETSLALAGLAWCFVWAGDRSTHRLALVCGDLPFIRPELGLCSVLMLANAALDRPRRLSVWLGLAAAAALPWALPMWWQTGSVFPSSLQAKRAWFIQDCIPWSQRASIVSLGLAMWLGLSAGTLPGLVGLCRERTGRLALALIALTILGWLVLAPGLTDGYQRFRYQAPLVAALTWGVSLLPRDQRRWALAWGAVASIAFGLQVTAVESAFRSGLRRDRTAVTTLLRSHGASRVMVHDAGYLAYADAAPVLVDMVGLKTPSAAADHARWTAPSCGEDRWRALDATARATRPEYLLIWQSWDELYSVTEGLDRAGWKVTRVSDLNGTLWLYRLSLPGRAGEGP